MTPESSTGDLAADSCHTCANLPACLKALVQEVVRTELADLGVRMRRDIHEELRDFMASSRMTDRSSWPCLGRMSVDNPKPPPEVEPMSPGDRGPTLLPLSSELSLKPCEGRTTAWAAPIRRRPLQSHARSRQCKSLVATLLLASNAVRGVQRASVARREQRQSTHVVLFACLDLGIALLVLLNGIFIGIQTDHMAKNPSDEEPPFFRICEIIFLLIFSAEMLVRLAWQRTDFLLAPEISFVVTSSGAAGSQSANMSHLRVLRFLRLLRVLRLLRLMHFIGKLNMIIGSVSKSLRSLCWTGLLLAMMMYIVGIIFTQVTVGYKLGMYADPSDVGMARLSMHWGSLSRSILSLYESILGGIDWDDLATPLSEHVSPLMAVLFCLYIGFALLAVMNVITGCFVESSMKQTEVEKELDFMRVAHDFFNSCDEDGSGTISFREFTEQIETPGFKGYCESLGIDTCDAKLLFTLLDSDDSGELEAQ